MLRVYIDFKSPASYLALKPTCALLEGYQSAVEWLPFLSSQNPIPKTDARTSKGGIHRRVRAIANRNTHLLYAGIQNTPMRWRESIGKTELALAALLYAGPNAAAYMQHAFEAYWVRHDDLNDPATVTDLLVKAGLDATTFHAEHSLARLAENQQQASGLGIVNAPAYVIDDQVFIGREHLPWIESILKTVSAA